VSTTSVNLLRAASDIIGGDAALARRLGIGQTLLQGFLADRYELPDALMLRAVDIILEDRQCRLAMCRENPDGANAALAAE